MGAVISGRAGASITFSYSCHWPGTGRRVGPVSFSGAAAAERCEQGWAPGTATRALLPHTSPRAAGCCPSPVPTAPGELLRAGKGGELDPARPAGSSCGSGWQDCGAGSQHCPGTAWCCRLLWLQLNNKGIYFGTNNPPPGSRRGFPSRSAQQGSGWAIVEGKLPGVAGLQGWILHKPQLAVPADIKATVAGLSRPALPRVPGPAPQNNPSTPKQPQHPQTAPRWGGLGDGQLLQQPARMGAPHPNQSTVCPRMSWILHAEQGKALRSAWSDLWDGQELLTAT